MASCMLPTLQLLDTCRQCPAPNQDMAKVIKTLEGLLCDHIILPLRHSFLNPEPTTELETEVPFTSFCDQKLSLMRSYLPQL